MIVLIPAYEPDARLVTLVQDLRAAAPDLPVVVVDDGSGPAYAPVLAAARAAGADVVGYAHNRGKGHALRHGFAHARATHPGHDVVTADCDGQHAVVDVLRVAARGAAEPGAVVLGSRLFVDEVPWRSTVGNVASRLLLRAVTGLRLVDTQTGLRAYPAGLLPWLAQVPGDRFEYELEVLLRAPGAGVPVVEVPIATIYLDGNASSHFRPVRDSVRVVAPLLRFAASSLAANVVDTGVLLVLQALTGSLGVAVVGARAVSATVNFAVNRRHVFAGARVPWRVSLARYAALAATLLGATWALLAVLTHVGVPLLVAKVGTDVTLLCVSYGVQRAYVFAHRAPVGAVGAAPAADVARETVGTGGPRRSFPRRT